jgi:hypothetical protein
MEVMQRKRGLVSQAPFFDTVLNYFAGAGAGVAGALVLVLALWLLLPSQARALPETETPNTNNIAMTTALI